MKLTDKQLRLHSDARIRMSNGDHAGAADILRQLVRKTRSPQLMSELANVLMTAGRFDEARTTLGRLVQAVPRSAEARFQLSMCLRSMRRYDEALAEASAALDLKPRYADAIAAKGELLHLTGRYQDAYDTLRPAIDAGISHPRIAYALGRVARQLGRLDEAAELLERMARAERTPAPKRADALFELAAIHEQRGDYDAAWATAVEANELQEDRFRPRVHEAMIERIVAGWTPDAVAALRESGGGSDDPTPVFIVGMPRSGTSLTEQIIASHPRAAGGGERQGVIEAVRALQPHDDGPAHVDDPSALTSSDIARAARDYLRDLRTVSKTADRITDKLVFNFLNLGVIAAMFPKARIIHCVRDPLDTAISCYFQSFLGVVYFANRIPSIGVFHRSYVRLMDHWKRVLDTPILDVDYQRLVADQEPVTREILDFIGLEFDDACIRFHQNERVTWTASIDQVRRPMYGSSVARWKRYEEHIGPLRAAMGL